MQMIRNAWARIRHSMLVEPGRRTRPLWRIGIVLILAFAGALFTAAAVFYIGWTQLDVTEVKAEGAIDSKTLFELVKLAFGVVAGAGALVALVVAYRKQRVDEASALREDTRLHTERFTAAVGQLGDASPAIRLGGVHALAGLADDAPTRALRQTCIDVLCSYLRMPYKRVPDEPEEEDAHQEYVASRQVRHSVLTIIADHLRETGLPSWKGHAFNFEGATFDGGSMRTADFTGCQVSFYRCTFVDGGLDLVDCIFGVDTVVTFARSSIQGVLDLDEAMVAYGAKISFNRAVVEGGMLLMEYGVVDGEVDFTRLVVNDGGLHLRLTHVAPYGAMSFQRALFRDTADVDFTDWTIEEPAPHPGRQSVNFSRAIGPAPLGVIPSSEPRTLGRLILPEGWRPESDAEDRQQG